jgi:beta-glucosidase
VSADTFSDQDSLRISVTVTNSGEIAGKEVVQLYVRDESASVVRPVKELRGFALQPGESRKVTFTLSERDFAFYSQRHGRWLAESGNFELLVGSSSRDIRERRQVTLQSTRSLNYSFTQYSFFREIWSNPELKPMLVELMPNWLRSQAPDGRSASQARVENFLQDQPMIKFPAITLGEIDAEDVKAFIQRCNSLTFTP